MGTQGNDKAKPGNQLVDVDERNQADDARMATILWNWQDEDFYSTPDMETLKESQNPISQLN